MAFSFVMAVEKDRLIANAPLYPAETPLCG
jgi:hypothetical protein